VRAFVISRIPDGAFFVHGHSKVSEAARMDRAAMERSGGTIALQNMTGEVGMLRLRRSFASRRSG
jgi:hypothetical protein